MAIGFPPKHTQAISLDGLTPAQFLAISVATVQDLGWSISYVSDAGLIAFTAKKLFKPTQKLTIRITDEQVDLRSESIGSELFDMGRNKMNLDQFTDLLAEKRTNSSPEQLEQAYEELKPGLVASDDDDLAKPPATARENWASFFLLFIPRQGYFITPILVDLNIAIFILMVISGANFFMPGVQSLIYWGANVRMLTLDGQWWRIVTCCFIHIGIFHLLLNMYALLYIGLLLEPQLGRRRFAAAYLLTGITASLASLYWHTNSASAGASGAIFGMYGVFLALLTTNLIEKTRRAALLTSIGIFVGYNLLFGASGVVDNAAHIGGLIGGIVIGYLYYPGLVKPGKPGLLYSAIAVAALLVMTTTFLAFAKIPNEYGLYQKKMVSFDHYEKRALGVFKKLNSDTPKEVWRHAIQDSGIYYWNQCIRVLDEANELNVSSNVKQRSDALIQYCHLRIQSYSYFYKKIEGTVGPGEDSTAIYNTQISEVLQELKNDK